MKKLLLILSLIILFQASCEDYHQQKVDMYKKQIEFLTTMVKDNQKLNEELLEELRKCKDVNNK